MDIKEVLEFIDEMIASKTGKHLNDLQRKVIEGALNHQKYADIADHNGKSEGHIKDVGYEVLQLLSNIFDEPVTKFNLQSVLERKGNFNLSFGEQGNINSSVNGHVIGCINFGKDESNNNANKNKLKTTRRRKSKKITKIQKLKEKGLSDEEIADILEIDLALIKDID